MSYRIALKRLLAYEPKKLVVGWYKNECGCCVVGAILPSSRRHNSKDVWAVLDDQVCRSEIHAMGLTDDHNDSLRSHSAEDRYEQMVRWLQDKVATTLPPLDSGEVTDAR